MFLLPPVVILLMSVTSSKALNIKVLCLPKGFVNRTNIENGTTKRPIFDNSPTIPPLFSNSNCPWPLVELSKPKFTLMRDITKKTENNIYINFLFLSATSNSTEYLFTLKQNNA